MKDTFKTVAKRDAHEMRKDDQCPRTGPLTYISVHSTIHGGSSEGCTQCLVFYDHATDIANWHQSS